MTELPAFISSKQTNKQNREAKRAEETANLILKETHSMRPVSLTRSVRIHADVLNIVSSDTLNKNEKVLLRAACLNIKAQSGNWERRSRKTWFFFNVRCVTYDFWETKLLCKLPLIDEAYKEESHSNCLWRTLRISEYKRKEYCLEYEMVLIN